MHYAILGCSRCVPDLTFGSQLCHIRTAWALLRGLKCDCCHCLPHAVRCVVVVACRSTATTWTTATSCSMRRSHPEAHVAAAATVAAPAVAAAAEDRAACCCQPLCTGSTAGQGWRQQQQQQHQQKGQGKGQKMRAARSWQVDHPAVYICWRHDVSMAGAVGAFKDSCLNKLLVAALCLFMSLCINTELAGRWHRVASTGQQVHTQHIRLAAGSFASAVVCRSSLMRLQHGAPLLPLSRCTHPRE
jgi:hypothetical protein